MKNKKTYYHLVLDRSGSMHSCWPETLAGFSNQLDKIRELAVSYPEQSFYASLCTFNHVPSFPHGISPVDGQTSLSLDGIRPEGNTGLFDAIGESIRRLEFAVSDEISRGEASVVVVVLTDGHENSSQQYTAADIKAEMDRLKAGGQYSFAFVGMDFDVADLAERFGMAENSRRNFSKADMAGMFNKVGDQLHQYAFHKQRGGMMKEFFEEPGEGR